MENSCGVLHKFSQVKFVKKPLLKYIKKYLAEPGNWGLLSNTQPLCVLDWWITAVSEIRWVKIVNEVSNGEINKK